MRRELLRRPQEPFRSSKARAIEPDDHPALHLQRLAGNHAARRVFRSALRISEPGDGWEREADSVADRMMHMHVAGTEGDTSISAMPPDARRSAASPSPDGLVPNDGHALPRPVRRLFEPFFGVTLGGVRVHTGSAAAESARALDARAYTVGGDIVFDHGQYRPEASEGRKLLAHELTHVVQQGERAQGSRPAVYPQRRRELSPRVRLPTLEAYSALSGGAFATRGTPLTSSERSDAQFVFQSSIDLDTVRIVEAPVVNAPTTLGNYIRIAPGTTMSRDTLIHELAHVWQYQTKGTSYISDSLLHQAAAAITTGSRAAAYSVTIVPGQSIHRYTAEQQAVIIEQYFSDPAVRSDPDYQRMIAEVRRSRPLPSSLILEEALFGPGMGTQRLMPPPTGGPGEMAPVAPLIRIEF